MAVGSVYRASSIKKLALITTDLKICQQITLNHLKLARF